MSLRLVLFGVLVAALSACPKPAIEVVDSGPIEVDFGASFDAGIDAGPIDAGRPALQLDITVLQPDGGIVPVASGARQIEVDSASALQLSANIDLADARIRVIDWADRVVPSDDVGSHDGGLSYSMTFLEPLKSGRSYQLLVDSQSGLNVTDVTGTVHDDVELLIQIRGDVVPEPGAKLKPKSKKRR